MEERHIYVTGTVQGVGFRAAVKRHAQLFNIKGYAKNLSDGRVEICAQGTPDQINEFVHRIQTHSALASISHIETKLNPIQEYFSSFEIR